MAKDPAFLFYPGDYLQDTQTLSEKTQVAYDRIMCEHMRNICISKKQLKFFTKKLNDDEIEELMFVLTEIDGGFQIDWVARSIEKRRAYSDSRRKNRSKSNKKSTQKNPVSYDNHMRSYDKHMENENENENENKNKSVNEIENEKSSEKNSKVVLPFQDPEFEMLWDAWKDYKKREFKFRYKSPQSEQAALTKLNNLSEQDPDSAKAIIMESMSNGWKGFFELKHNTSNGKKQKFNQAKFEAAIRREAGKFDN